MLIVASIIFLFMGILGIILSLTEKDFKEPIVTLISTIIFFIGILMVSVVINHTNISNQFKVSVVSQESTKHGVRYYVIKGSSGTLHYLTYTIKDRIE